VLTGQVKHVWELLDKHLQQQPPFPCVGPCQDDGLEEGLLNTA
jgi:hypothetical protein